MCKKCLTRDMPDSSFFQNMYDYIESLDEDIKVSEEEYERRLMICKGCEFLLNGMCRKCGCFVEMRAIIKIKGCPSSKSMW